MRTATGGLITLLSLCSIVSAQAQFVCDADSDCFLVPDGSDERQLPALLILSCTGAVPNDIDSNRLIADSLGWVLASCHRARNHRTAQENGNDIARTMSKLLNEYPVDPNNVFICGFSGMGAQALFELTAHPDLFRGAVTACAPQRRLPQENVDALVGHAVYLVSRKNDWNLAGNRILAQELSQAGVATKLVVTDGEHEPGDVWELLAGCRWVWNNTP